MSEKWDEKVIELAKSLINCQSYSGHEDKAAEALKAYMKETGVFDEIETDCYGNVIILKEKIMVRKSCLMDI